MGRQSFPSGVHGDDVTLLTANPFMFLERNEIPKLPIPQLRETLRRYLDKVRPLLSQEAYEVTVRNVDQFSEGEGPKLQGELHRLAEESPTSWLEGFWDTGYLEYRVPCPIHVNPFFIIHPTPNMSQLTRASELTLASVRLWQTIKSGSLPNEKVKGNIQCMTSYWRVFGTCRLPLPGRDKLYTCPTSKHIAVFCNNQVYSLEVLDATNVPFAAPSIARALQIIKRHSRTATNENGTKQGGMGLWTCENRDVWSKIRSTVTQNTENARIIHEIDSAIFVLCLDQEPLAINDPNARSQRMLHSKAGENRWFDKLQLIVCLDGSAAFNMEHSPHDGHTLLQCSSFIYDDICGIPIPGSSRVTSPKKTLHYLHLSLQVDDMLRHTISVARENMKLLSESVESSVLDFRTFGTRDIKKLKVSPDAFIQMAYQLAYYRMVGHVASTYESVNMKGYYHGRTEVIRSVSMKSKQFCELYDHKNISYVAKSKLIREAIGQHIQSGKESKQGASPERHLMGLKELARHKQVRLPLYDIPALFTDPAYSTFSTSVISTSNCGGHALDLFGFGPVTGNGLGIGYIAKSDCLLFNVTSFISQASTYTSILRLTLIEMYSTLHGEINGKKKISKL